MKRGFVAGIVIAIIIVIILVIYFSPLKNKLGIPSSCGVQGETFDFTESDNPQECCEGLDNVHTSDSVSVADKCYWTGTESGAPIITCSDCGNGVCDSVESVCGCLEDCIEKGKSDYNNIEEFCSEGYNQYCTNIPEGFELELCNLC